VSGLYKNIIFLLIAVIYIVSSAGNSFAQARMSNEIKKLEEKKKKDLENFKLTKPKNVEYILNGEKKGFSKFDAKGNCIENGFYIGGKKITKQIFEYDSSGNNTKQTNLNEEGSVEYFMNNTFSAEGNLISAEYFYYDGKPGDKEFHKYDEKGNLIEIDYNLSSGKLKYFFDYDSSNNKINEKSYHEDSLYYNGIIIYNEKNIPIEEIKNYISAGSVDTIRYYYKYDAKGNLIEFSKVSPDTNETFTEKYKLDANYNTIEYTSYNSRSKLEYRYLYNYDEKNNLIELFVYNGDNNPDRKEIYKYDNDNHLTENVTFDADETILNKITKRYDKKGNVTEETDETGGKTDKWIYVYEYYE
jgi:hypothetical protein